MEEDKSGELSGPATSDRSPGALIVQAHEEFIQHIEASQGRIKTLSIITLIVAIFLGASYAAQIVYPFATGQTVVTVNLTDPSLLVLELVGLLLTFAWIFVGVTDYLFASRLGNMIRRARTAERELENQLNSQPKS